MSSDPYWSSVSMLLHMNGTNGSTTFTDSSSYARTMTAVGNAQISTAQYKFGGASGLFDGSGDYLTTPSAAALQLGSSDFTIDAWVRFAGWPVSEAGVYAQAIVAKAISSNAEFYFYVVGTASSITSLRFIGFTNNTTYQNISVSHSFSLNTTYLVSVSRVGNLLYLLVDGILKNVGGTSFTTTIQSTSQQVSVGRIMWDATYKYELNGYLDDLRITKGVGRYTSDFSVPVNEYPDANYSYASVGGSISGGVSGFWRDYTGQHSEVSVGGSISGGTSTSYREKVFPSVGGTLSGGTSLLSRIKNYNSIGGSVSGGISDTLVRSALLQTYISNGGSIFGGRSGITWNTSRAYSSTGGTLSGGISYVIRNKSFVSTGGSISGGTSLFNTIETIPVTPVRKFKAEPRTFTFRAQR